MILIFGSRTYGSVDSIRGLGYVATEFFHLYYIPVVPYRTRFVIKQEAEGFIGGTLPLDWKSITVAWLRTVGLLATLFFLAVAVLAMMNPLSSWLARLVLLALLALSGSLLWVSYSSWARVASYQRALTLARDLKMDPRLCIYIDLIYDQINQAEADRRLDQLGFAADELEDLDDELAASGLDEWHEFR